MKQKLKRFFEKKPQNHNNQADLFMASYEEEDINETKRNYRERAQVLGAEKNSTEVFTNQAALFLASDEEGNSKNPDLNGFFSELNIDYITWDQVRLPNTNSIPDFMTKNAALALMDPTHKDKNLFTIPPKKQKNKKSQKEKVTFPDYTTHGEMVRHMAAARKN